MNWIQRAYYWFGFALVVYGMLGFFLSFLPPVLNLGWGITTALAGALLMQISLTWFKSKPRAMCGAILESKEGLESV